MIITLPLVVSILAFCFGQIIVGVIFLLLWLFQQYFLT